MNITPIKGVKSIPITDTAGVKGPRNILVVEFDLDPNILQAQTSALYFLFNGVPIISKNRKMVESWACGTCLIFDKNGNEQHALYFPKERFASNGIAPLAPPYGAGYSTNLPLIFDDFVTLEYGTKKFPVYEGSPARPASTVAACARDLGADSAGLVEQNCYILQATTKYRFEDVERQTNFDSIYGKSRTCWGLVSFYPVGSPNDVITGKCYAEIVYNGLGEFVMTFFVFESDTIFYCGTDHQSNVELIDNILKPAVTQGSMASYLMSFYDLTRAEVGMSVVSNAPANTTDWLRPGVNSDSVINAMFKNYFGRTYLAYPLRGYLVKKKGNSVTAEPVPKPVISTPPAPGPVISPPPPDPTPVPDPGKVPSSSDLVSDPGGVVSDLTDPVTTSTPEASCTENGDVVINQGPCIKYVIKKDGSIIKKDQGGNDTIVRDPTVTSDPVNDLDCGQTVTLTEGMVIPAGVTLIMKKICN